MRTQRRRSRSGGFTLIELGIVIAVIAILASVVIFGLGFLQGSRVTKAVDAANTIRKAASTVAGLQGGTIGTSTANEVSPLAARGLLPTSANAGTWVVTGSGTNSFTVTNVQYGQDTTVTPSQNSVAIQITTPNATASQDVFMQFRGTAPTPNDPNLIMTSPTLGSINCPGATPPAGTTVTLCFHL